MEQYFVTASFFIGGGDNEEIVDVRAAGSGYQATIFFVNGLKGLVEKEL